MFRQQFWSLMHNIANGCTTPGQKLLLFGILAVFSFGAAIGLNFFFWQLICRWRPGWRMLKKRAGGFLQMPLFWCFFLTGLYHSLMIFNLKPVLTERISRGYFSVMMLLVSVWFLKAVTILAQSFREKAEKNGSVYHLLLINLLAPAVKTVVWLVIILFVLDNVFHFHVGTLLAGAGVASMAIAFAAQNTIANLFGAVSLIIERPFQPGQTIRINDKEGIVEAIGLRSVRLLASDGTIWFVPNRTLAESPIINVSERKFCKYNFVLNLTYAHTPEQMQQAKVLLREILSQQLLVDQQLRPPVIVFDNFGAYSLDIQISCWLLTSNMRDCNQAKNEINLQILQRFNAAGFDFAFPTQSICVEKMPAEV